jgi:hypothetical protein
VLGSNFTFCEHWFPKIGLINNLQILDFCIGWATDQEVTMQLLQTANVALTVAAIVFLSAFVLGFIG